MKTKFFWMVAVVSLVCVLGIEYHEIDTVNGPVRETVYTKAMYEATLRNLRPPTSAQTLTAAGTASTNQLITLLNITSGTVAVGLPNGALANQVKELHFIGSGGVVNVAGTFHLFTTLQFDTNARTATLRWVNSKWMPVAGNYRGL